ncbi:MAG: CPBP family intramembrane glutamic endopeptidase [Limnochordia bacterium]
MVILSMLGSACLVVPSLAATIAGTLVGEGSVIHYLGALCAQQVLWGLLAGWQLFGNLRLDRNSIGWPTRPKSEDVYLGVLAGMILAGMGGVATWLSKHIFAAVLGAGRTMAIYYRELASLHGIIRYESSLWILSWLLLIVTVVAPVCEELFFRGYLYGALKAHLGVAHAVWVNSLLFAVFHLYVVQGPAIFLTAVGLTSLYERRGSLWVCIVAHATFNLVVAGFWLLLRVAVKG